MSEQAHPLDWPAGWARTPSWQRKSDKAFHGKTYGLTIDRARRQLTDELARLGVDRNTVVISSNLRLRQDGFPASNQAKMLDDPGVAVYFMRKKRAMVMAVDAYSSVPGNLRSLSLAIEAMRQLERHGGGTMMERAFTGFAAIAPPNWKKPWREVFSAPHDWRPSGDELARYYRAKARERHPDAGGSDTLMAELNVAYAEAKSELGL